MNYLLDTCILSEFTKRKPEEKVIQWIDDVEEEHLYISVITVGEIQRGVERLPESHRKTQLQVWMNNGLVERFTGRMLPIDTETMLLWGSLMARSEQAGQPMGVMDSLITATALQHNLALVTRNVSDFQSCGVSLINPWE
jgi:predicted nucleic acid-binding protein